MELIIIPVHVRMITTEKTVKTEEVRVKVNRVYTVRIKSKKIFTSVEKDKISMFI